MANGDIIIINKIYLKILEINKGIIYFFKLDKIKEKCTLQNKFIDFLRENPVIELTILCVSIVVLIGAISFRTTSLNNYNEIQQLLNNDISIEGNVITNNSGYTIENLSYGIYNSTYASWETFTINRLNPGQGYTVNGSSNLDIAIDNNMSTPTLIKTNNLYLFMIIIVICLIVFKVLFIDDYDQMEKIRNKINSMEEFNNDENVKKREYELKIKLAKQKILKEESEKQIEQENKEIEEIARNQLKDNNDHIN